MGFLKWLGITDGGRELAVFRVFMHYEARLSSGRGGVGWTPIEVPDPPLPESELLSVGVALLYARILAAHSETRAELFARVGTAAEQVLESNGTSPFDFASWNLRVGFGAPPQTIWPWQILSATDMSWAKAYTASLRQGPPARLPPLGLWLHLDMRGRQERVKAPASALLALHCLSSKLNPEERTHLASLLLGTNRHFGSPGHVKIGTEFFAVGSALSDQMEEARSQPNRTPARPDEAGGRRAVVRGRGKMPARVYRCPQCGKRNRIRGMPAEGLAARCGSCRADLDLALTYLEKLE